VGEVLKVYSKRGVLNDTYVVFTADHGHTSVLADKVHDLALGMAGNYSSCWKKNGLRVRKPALSPTRNEQDYQVVFAAEGFATYLYVANRSTCAKAGERCDWRKLPRFRQDLLLVSHNNTGEAWVVARPSADSVQKNRPA